MQITVKFRQNGHNSDVTVTQYYKERVLPISRNLPESRLQHQESFIKKVLLNIPFRKTMFETCVKRGSANAKTSTCFAIFTYSISSAANFNSPINQLRNINNKIIFRWLNLFLFSQKYNFYNQSFINLTTNSVSLSILRGKKTVNQKSNNRLTRLCRIQQRYYTI